MTPKPVVTTCLLALLGASAFALPGRAADDAPASPPELGPAPRLDVPQELPAARALSQQAEALSSSRDTVVDLYRSVYVPGSAVSSGWTGAVPDCDAGTTALAHRQAVIDRVNYFRALAALPPVSLLGSTPTIQSQASALMMSANNALDHSPPTDWLCYTADGAFAAGKSNLAWGIHGVGAIDLYIDDNGSGNYAVGHRRWILHPPQVSMATGDITPTGSTNRPTNDLYVLGTFGTRPATPNGVAWPPAGFVPFQNLPSRSNRWSFSFPGANFTAATIMMSGPGGSIPVTLETIANGYGDNTIVFRPTGVSYARPAADTTYTVTVDGMTGTGVPSTLSYTVTVIDPDADGIPIAPPALQGAASRKTHGAVGSFDLPLDATLANPTTEPRAGPAHTIVFTFDKPVVSGNASVSVGTASAGTPTFLGNEMRVPLAGVANAQYVTVSASNVVAADGGSGGSGSVRVGFLVGDVTQNRAVTVSDVAQVNAVIAQPVTASSYLKDLNASGTLTVADKATANVNVTRALPAP
jgi:uncharacterized protein YkwD